MARLIIEALAEDTIAAPGNRQHLYLVASVTSTTGRAVTGLSAANFTIQAVIVGPGGALVQVVSGGETLPGVYLIFLEPFGNNTWSQGVYIFSVAVERGADRGQTLTQVLLD
jgi:hypothetical protein